MTNRPEWLTKLLPAELPEPEPSEEVCLDVSPTVYRHLGMRPRHHWDSSPRILGGKDFCLRCDLKRCQQTLADPRAKKAGLQCERHSRHRGKHQRYKGNGKIDKRW